MPLNVKLVVVGGDAKTTEISLKLPSIIGRGRGMAVVLPHPLVSRQHCELYESEGQLMVRDMGSLNGTFVNNERITESLLGPDELLTIGTVTFRAVYELEAGKAPAASTRKERPGEKTLKVAKATTKAATKAPEPKKMTQDSSGPLEFDFDHSGATISQPPKGTEAVAESKPTEPLPTKKSESKQSAQPGKEQKKPAKASADDEDSSESGFKPSASSDDDLNDFLDSLKDK
jgi:hypothetical protein